MVACKTKIRSKVCCKIVKLKSLPSTKTGGLPSELPLFIDMPVMSTKNISTELGLTNGTFGVIKSIPLTSSDWDKGCNSVHYLESFPDYVVVEFDNINMTPLDGLESKHVPVFTKDVSFSFIENKKAINKKSTVKCFCLC